MKGLVCLIALSLAGCAVTPPDGAHEQWGYRAKPTAIRIEAEHVSHLLVGMPFNPENEDGLSQVSVIARWQVAGPYFELGAGYNLAGKDGGGFKGPSFLTTLRAGYEWRLR